MRKLLKNKKVLFLLPILFIVFGFFLITSSRKEAPKAAEFIPDCDRTCSDCTNDEFCRNSDSDCMWDTERDQCAWALEIDWPTSPGGKKLTGLSDVGDMIQYFYEWAIVLGGVTVFSSLVMGGFKYLSSMGRPEVMKESKDQISSAFLGLILLLSAWLILNTINPALTTFKRASYSLDHIMETFEAFHLDEPPGCDYAELYGGEDFWGTPLVIPATGGSTKLERQHSYKLMEDFTGYTPVSVKSFLKNTSGLVPECETPPCECTGHGCGCVLQLFATAKDEITGVVKKCGSKLGEIVAWDKNILVYEGGGEEGTQKITCLRLAGGACQCREKEGSTCTGIIPPDTGWGDNLYNCIGTNETSDNARCVDGECVICDGKIHNDGCSGCAGTGCTTGRTANDGSISSCTSGGENKACWWVQPSDQRSCNYRCQSHDAECIQTNWDDDSSCTLCRRFYPSKGCGAWIYSNAPGFSHGSVCRYRAWSEGQNCGGVYMSMGRFCVCTF